MNVYSFLSFFFFTFKMELLISRNCTTKKCIKYRLNGLKGPNLQISLTRFKYRAFFALFFMNIQWMMKICCWRNCCHPREFYHTYEHVPERSILSWKCDVFDTDYQKTTNCLYRAIHVTRIPEITFKLRVY